MRDSLFFERSCAWGYFIVNQCIMKKYLIIAALLLLGASSISCTKYEPDSNTLDAKKSEGIVTNGKNIIR